MILRRLLFFCLLALSLPAFAQQKVYVIEITGEIDLGLVPYVERVVKEADAANAAAIVLHVNTFGGRVDAATEIKDAMLDAHAPTIAFVDKQAISAGAFITLSCKKIVMSEGSTMGAATPIYETGEKASEKVNSFMRSEMRSLAESNHRRSDIAEAMVDEDVVLKDSVLDKPKGKLLTLTTDEAIKVGYCDTTASSVQDALNKLGYKDVTLVNTSESWSEQLVKFFTSSIVSGFLILIGLAGLFYAFKTGHFGWFAIIGLLAFALFFGASYIAKLSTVLVILAFLAGIFFLILEIGTPIPTFGIAGVIGIVLAIGALFYALVGDLHTGNTTRAMWILSGSIAGFIVLAVIMFRTLPKSTMWSKFILTHEEKPSAGYVTPTDYNGYVGKEGES
ncbi:MAG TPA: ATP-dependent Clp protease proteolytic subunit, partial [Candidatus Kapabacteria bacterium]|nr:ATP-dependent Clp protease proteolytic subunit [Candidatus Kapabacteria bacterium]